MGGLVTAERRRVGWLGPASLIASGPRTAASLLGVVLLVTASIAGLFFVHWRTDLHLFDGVGNELGTGSLKAGSSIYVGDQIDASRGPVSVTLDTVTPVVTANSAGATVRVVLCSPTTDALQLLGATSVTEYCTSSRGFAPGRVRLDPNDPRAGTTIVLVQITPTHAGHVHVAGVHVRYHRGLRSGDQVTGLQVDTQTH